MPKAVKLSSNIVDDARVISKAMHRSVAGQIEHWAKIGKIAEENPEMNYAFIKDLLIAQQESKDNSLTRYEFD